MKILQLKNDADRAVALYRVRQSLMDKLPPSVSINKIIEIANDVVEKLEK